MEPLTPAQVREVDRRAIEVLGLPGIVLMENAGGGFARLVLATFARELERAGPETPVVVCCGGGNNGGDGYVIARHLYNAGVAVRIVATAALERLPPDAHTNRVVAERMGLAPLDATASGAAETVAAALSAAPVVVDALLGTGFRGDLREPLASLVAAANAAPGRRAAVDVPSGLDAGTGRPSDPTFRADLTGTFVAPKTGFASAAAWLGRVHVLSIGAPPELAKAVRTVR